MPSLGGLALLGGIFLAGPEPQPTQLPSTGLPRSEIWTPPRIAAVHPKLMRIVLDPGHGGHDPGAEAGHLNEAAIVLDVATRLEARLRTHTGIEVVMTRRDDVFLSLEARTSMANCLGADLFLSIHANASQNQVASGIATYHLRNGSPTTATARTASLAAPPAALDDSRDLAELVQRNLVRSVRQLHPDALDQGVHEATFVVLLGATMPSVLTEISFLTNEYEAALLSTGVYLDQISDALLRSILDYQEALPLPARASADGPDRNDRIDGIDGNAGHDSAAGND